MFCPKCGKSLPDNASFCGSCGNKLKAPTANVGQQTMVTPNDRNAYDRFATAAMPSPAAAASQASQNSAASPFTVVGIVARVSALAAFVCMMMPWVSVPVANAFSQLGASFGISDQQDFSYFMFNMGDVSQVMDLLPSGNFGTLQTVLFAAWLVAAIVLVGGLVASFALGKRTARPVIPGAIAAAVVALAWFAFISACNADIASVATSIAGVSVTAFELPPSVLLTALFGVVSCILAILDKPQA